jgi:hypothetical protein
MRKLALISAVIALAASACGRDDSEAAPKPPPRPPAPEPEIGARIHLCATGDLEGHSSSSDTHAAALRGGVVPLAVHVFVDDVRIGSLRLKENYEEDESNRAVATAAWNEAAARAGEHGWIEVDHDPIPDSLLLTFYAGRERAGFPAERVRARAP